MRNALLALLLAAPVAAQPATVTFEHAFDTVALPDSHVFSRDGKTYGVGAAAGISFWDTASGVQRGLIPIETKECGKDRYCDAALLALSPDGTLALVSERVGSYSGTAPKDYSKGEYGAYKFKRTEELALWDTVTEKRLRVLHKHSHACRKTGSAFQPFQCTESAADFSPDGKRLAVRLPTGEKDWRLEGEKNLLFDLSSRSPRLRSLGGLPFFTTDGRLLTLVIRGGSAEIRDEDAEKRLSFLQDYAGKIENWAMSADGSALAAVFRDDNHVRVRAWDLATGRAVLARNRYVERDYFGSGVLLSPDGRRLLELEMPLYDQFKPTIQETLAGASTQAVSLPVTNYYATKLSSDGRWLAGERPDRAARAVYRVNWGAAAPAVTRPAPPAPRVNLDAPPAALTAVDPGAYAVVVGVEKYRQTGIPAVDYAARDATAMHAYLTGAMGFDPKNVVLLIDAQATKTDLEKTLGTWLKNRVDAKSRVFVYYAGHGAPNPTTGEGYLMPYEADPNYLDDTAYPVARLYATLGKLPTKDVTVVLDACFSGSGGRSLLAKGARPLVSVVSAKAPAGVVVLAATGGGQISASDPERRHGLLTGALLEALHGAADADGDARVGVAEIFAFVRPAVERAARLQNLEQTPTLNLRPETAPIRPWVVLAPPEKR